MKKRFVGVFFVLLLAACGGGGGTDAPIPQRITFSNAGQLGIFDPSLARDPATNRVWMSYSAVDPSSFYVPTLYWKVSIRLAYSDDNGGTWHDGGVPVAAAMEQVLGPLASTAPLPSIPADSMGVWQSETSTLIYDPGAPIGERWKVLWFQYLNANLTPYFFDYSWLAMKSAATPEGLATATPVKLFAGFGLQADGEITSAPVFSPLGGPPVIHLNSDLSQAVVGADLAELDHCVFAEPGLYANTNAVYLATFCGDPITNEKYIVGFRCAAPCSMTSAAGWEYLGRLLTPTDATDATGHDQVQAPAFVEQAGKVYLVVTPVDAASGNRYDGCRVYVFDDIDAGSLLRDTGGQVTEIQRIDGQAGLHNGACAGYAGLAGGLLYSQYEAANPPETFRVYKSGVSIP